MLYKKKTYNFAAFNEKIFAGGGNKFNINTTTAMRGKEIWMAGEIIAPFSPFPIPLFHPALRLVS